MNSKLEPPGIAILARASNQLNNWMWPKKPKGWDSMTMDQKYSISVLLIQAIEKVTGRKAVLRDHNRDMTDEQFERWWAEEREVNHAA